MKSHLTKPHHSYNNLNLGHTPAIYEVNDPPLETGGIGMVHEDIVIMSSDYVLITD